MPLDPILLERLVCPDDHGPLLYVTDTDGSEILYNPRLRRVYRIDDGIPVLLVSEGRTADEAEHAALVARSGTEG
ncbi:Trm112 family protein [Williamsia sp. CHRR-6]|uniref:Trm112 family protein n=1 Tax=Williamsia sp. CHRR-6 TaxID=2835871 RepID=UPI001BD9421C|nr:Trm112 family protein [Williamsia sp. CHRR-6]MBT0565156.1 Trm112 family protein [Williamsia sp. CHRR-6]